MDFVSTHESIDFIVTIIQKIFAGCCKSCGEATPYRSAGFQTCRVADFPIGGALLRFAGLETRDTADLEVCATEVAAPLRCVFWGLERVAGIEPA